eukprot:1334828-Amorphochlora_amoeboformis.AAC.1
MEIRRPTPSKTENQNEFTSVALLLLSTTLVADILLGILPTLPSRSPNVIPVPFTLALPLFGSGMGGFDVLPSFGDIDFVRSFDELCLYDFELAFFSGLAGALFSSAFVGVRLDAIDLGVSRERGLCVTILLIELLIWLG